MRGNALVEFRHRCHQPLDILRARQPVIAILDQREHDIVARDPRDQRRPHAATARLRPSRLAGSAPGIRSRSAPPSRRCLRPSSISCRGDQIGLLRIFRRPPPGALLFDLLSDLGREALPHQRFGEIDRRRDQHQAGKLPPGAPAGAARRSRASRSEIHPPIDEPMAIVRSAAKCREHRDSFLRASGRSCRRQNRRRIRHARNNRSACRRGLARSPIGRAPAPWCPSCRT